MEVLSWTSVAVYVCLLVSVTVQDHHDGVDHCLTCSYHNGRFQCVNHESCDDDGKACYIQVTRDSYHGRWYNGYHGGCTDRKNCGKIASVGIYHNHRVVKGECCYTDYCNTMHFLSEGGNQVRSTTQPTTTTPTQHTTAKQTTTATTEATTVIETTEQTIQPPSTSVPSTSTTLPSTTEGYRLCATYTDQTSPNPSNKQKCATAKEMCFLQQYTAPNNYKLYRSGCSTKQNCDVISDTSRDPTLLYGKCSNSIEESLNEFLHYQHEHEMDNLRHATHCRKCTAVPLLGWNDCGHYQTCLPEQTCAVQVTNDGDTMNLFSECVQQTECNVLQTNYMHPSSSHHSLLCGSCCGNMTCAVDTCKRQLLATRR
ncbi:uncharacterized protein [Haliotis asinina]|uniref:uncharacterized protein n=1 Tax=Haliotis asinina TaxID=109174 RepID=UPI0035323E55